MCNDIVKLICQQLPYQELRWWQWYKQWDAISTVDFGPSHLLSYRGLLIQNLDVHWMPFSVRNDTQTWEWLYNFDTDVTVASCVDPTDLALVYWLDRASQRDYFRSADGIPWEIHLISDDAARVAAAEAFIRAQV